MIRINNFYVINVLLSLFILLFVGNANAKEKLELWIHPYLPASKLIKKFAPIAAYLSEKSGQTIQIQISKSYKAHVQRVGEGRIGLAYLGPVPYVQVTQAYGKQTPLACLEVNGRPYFHGLIVVRKDSPATTLKDLIGKNFAFGDPDSTMSHFVPRFMLLEAAVPVGKLNYEFFGTHQNVALNVLSGHCDAGGVKEEVYQEYRDRGLKILAQSPPIAEHLFVANNDLPQKTIDEFRQLLVNLKDQTVLSSIKQSVTGLSRVTDEDYDSLRLILKQLDTPSPE